MKKTLLTTVTATIMSALFAQQDTINVTNPDTLKVGNYVIIKKNKPANSDSTKSKKSITITSSTDDLLDIVFGDNDNSKNKILSTNWWIFDLGFANYRDETNYASAQTGSYFQPGKNGPVNQNSFSLINNKSSNVNIWFFMQKLSLVKQRLSLKYGLGLEMYNYRYEHSLSYRNSPTNYVFNDSISFSKNKLFVEYLTVPLMVSFTPIPDKKRSLCISAGVSAGYLIAARNKQISNERGKEKIRGNFDLEPFRLAFVGELGIGPIRLYGSYSLNTLHKSSTGLQQYPYTIGIRFSRW